VKHHRVETMTYFVYIIECQNGSYYTGYTTDIARRYKEHCDGSPKCKYTRSFPPKQLVAAFEFDNKSEALQKEAAIKKLSKKEKCTLIALSNS
jgi:putative endonuclease